MDLLTEVHAVEYMRDSMNGIMRVGMLSRFPHLGRLSDKLAVCHETCVSFMRVQWPSAVRVPASPLAVVADLQKYLAAGGHPSSSLEMQIKPPEIYGISKIPQPASAAMLLQRNLCNDQSGGESLL